MLGTLTFPADSAAAVAGNFGRIAPVPDFMKLIGPYVRSSIEGGISTISCWTRRSRSRPRSKRCRSVFEAP